MQNNMQNIDEAFIDGLASAFTLGRLDLLDPGLDFRQSPESKTQFTPQFHSIPPISLRILCVYVISKMIITAVCEFERKS